MGLAELVSMIAAAIGGAVGGYVSARKTPRGITDALARIEQRLQEGEVRAEGRFLAIETRLDLVEAVGPRPVQSPALRTR